MKTTLLRIYKSFFGSDIGFREKMLNMLAVTGVLAGIIMGSANAINAGEALGSAIGFGIVVFSLGMLIFLAVTGYYKIACIVTIVVIFLGYFPYLFFTMGGLSGSKILNFVFAIVFTAYVLEGKLGWFMMVLQLLIFAGICVYAYINPASVIPMPSEFNHMFDAIISMAFVSLAISIVFILHLRTYKRQQRKLDEQNTMLAGLNLSKTQFLANSSHEMRTPLTIVSVNVQNVIDMLNDMEDDAIDPEATELLKDTQHEIMRLSRMVGGMLTLASSSEAIERRRLNISEILHSTANTLQVHIQERGNILEIAAEAGLIIFGDADLLYQTLVNLIQNADKHSKNDTIKIKAERSKEAIVITVSDNGTGIPADLLPRVFERGVTDGQGTGYGLYLCKMIVESHGGKIWIKSEPDKGTSVYISLPDYGGQFGEGTV
ncbi:MAG: HAMP domain-containing histidine kinase [Defluviitaleaceae bacterium]|nr:HAMP domain-containing histidine kinase [Defluviitaleaceae bacterium]